jgi:regulator of extracellular matrix RemA (YlzA/DUF370 family)
MKKNYIGLTLAVVLFISCASGAFAVERLAPPTQSEKDPITGANQLSSDAFSIGIHARKVVKNAKNLVGGRHPNIILAEAHLKMATKFGITFSYYVQIYHLLRARKLACRVIEEKGERLKSEYLLTDAERRYSLVSPSTAELDRRVDPKKVDQAQVDASYIISRTAVVLTDVQRIPGHKAGLAQAVAHQQKARELFMNQAFREGIYHSLRARKLAFQIIQKNGEKLRPEFFLEAKERSYSNDSPKGAELDHRLEQSKIISDEEAAYIRIEPDI